MVDKKTDKQEAKDNTLLLLSVDYLNAYKKDEVKGTMKLAQEIGLKLIDMSKKDKDFPIRLHSYEKAKKGEPRKIIHALEIDLEKPIKED